MATDEQIARPVAGMAADRRRNHPYDLASELAAVSLVAICGITRSAVERAPNPPPPG
jgi:hypothetical protein